MAATLFATCPAEAQGWQRGKLLAKLLIDGLARPISVLSPPGDTERLFIVEKLTTANEGRIRIYNKNTSTLLSTPFLTIPGVDSSNEGGLLGLAFHPDYATNGFFYVNYLVDDSPDWKTVIRRYTANGPNYAIATTADPMSAHEVLSFSQPEDNHNGGWLGFHPTVTGPDRYYLYIASGDGGGGYDLHGSNGNGQDKTVLNGKILRIDVGANGTADDFPSDPLANYAVPSNNPFVGTGGGVKEEIWAYGLRNPWCPSFDSLTGDFWIPDVGQVRREEINFQPASDFTAASPVAANYGWRLREGLEATVPVGPIGGPEPADHIPPIIDYPHAFVGTPINTANGFSFEGDCVAGGVVYRGRMKWLQGAYIFGDHTRNKLFSLKYNSATNTVTTILEWSQDYEEFSPMPASEILEEISSITEGGDGEVYICTRGNNNPSYDGQVHVLTQAPYYLYRSTYFTFTELYNNSISGDSANPDEDLLDNLSEFALGTDPTKYDTAQIGVATETNGGANKYLTITLERGPESYGYVELEGCSGTDWFTMSPDTTLVILDTPTIFKVRDTIPIPSGIVSRRFLDINVELLLEATEDP